MAVPIIRKPGKGCRSAACKLRILTLSILLIALAKPASAGADTTPEWRLICREAYFLQRDRRYSEAIEKYRQALSKLGNADTHVTRELRLNIAVIIVLSGRTDEGIAALKALEPVFAKDNSLQAVRYWRKVRDAYNDQKDFGHAIEAQRKVLAIAKNNFDAESTNYLDELRKLMALFSFSHQVSEGMPIALHLKKAIQNLAPSERPRFIYDFEILTNVGFDESRESQRRGDFKKALNFLHLVKSIADPKLYMERLNELAQKQMPYEPKLKHEILVELLDTSGKLVPDKKAVEINQAAKNYIEQFNGASKK